MTGPLPAIELSPDGQRGAFPPPETSWAWAHTHLNFEVPPNTAPDEARKLVEEKLDGNPNLGCARLLCPRRLQANTRYTAFLIPAFEKGRLAGLGYSGAEIDSVSNAMASWLPAANVGGPRLFPVYFEWEFSTSSAGDFESLARRLLPLEPEAQQALEQSTQELDIQEPGWNIHYRRFPGSVAMESALQTLQASKKPITASQEEEDKAFVDSLRELVNLGAGIPSAETAGEDDPFVVPPLYGNFYRPEVKLNPGPPATWTDQLNLNPVYRAAAGQGTAVIQHQQEELMDRAWDQLGNYIDAKKADQHWELSLRTSRAFFKRFQPLFQQPSESAQFRAIALTSPMHGIMRGASVGKPNFSEALRGRFSGAYMPSFSRITRGNGPLMRRFSGRGQIQGQAFFNFSRIMGPIPNFMEGMVKNALGAITPSSSWGSMQGNSVFTENRIKNAGFISIANCREVLAALLPNLKSTPPPEDTGAPERFKKLHQSIQGQLDPNLTISARRNETVKLKDAQGNPIGKTTTFSVPDPMYRALAERSTDFILPGLDRIKPNRVVLLQPNQAFIESYMVGLNHEMAREFLWREYPAALDGTFFRQFWDVRDNPDAGEQLKNIAPILDWKTKALGVNRPQGASQYPLVVAIRGDLLRKYPDTEIYFHQAEGGTNRKPSSSQQAIRHALFSARIDPDYVFIGFDVSPDAATGKDGSAGWFFVLKERAGNVHFGLDIDIDPGNQDPSWQSLGSVQENTCINVESEEFKRLPRYGGRRADFIAGMLFQKPFMRYVHASRFVTTQ